jgi:secreted trypsin-like serine protease
MTKSLLIFALFLAIAACTKKLGAPALSSGENAGIIGGRKLKAQDPRAAFTVLIYKEDSLGHGSVCTGTFISQHAILTAAHCVNDDLDNMLIIFSVDPFGEEAEKVYLTASKVISHDQYFTDGKTVRNDIALIEFAEMLPAKAEIAKLPSGPMKINFYILGYGVNDASLQVGPLRLAQARINNAIVSDPKHFAADQSNKVGVCFGDSGGPAMTFSKNSATIVGVASVVQTHNIETEDAAIDQCHFRSLYMNVSYYTKWIAEKLSQ